MIREFRSFKEYREAQDPDWDNNLNGPSPGGAAAELETSRQRIHYLIKNGYLDAVYIYDGRELRAIIVTNASIKNFLQNPPPKSGPKKKVSLAEIAKWTITGMIQDVKAGRKLSDDEFKAWMEASLEGKDFKRRLNEQYGPGYFAVANSFLALTEKLGFGKKKKK